MKAYLINRWYSEPIYILMLDVTEGGVKDINYFTAQKNANIASSFFSREFSYRQAVALLKKWFPDVVRVSSGKFGTYGLRRKYFFVHKKDLKKFLEMSKTLP